MGCNPCSSPKPPEAPPPAETAQAQTQSNLQTAIANARLNRVNQTTPWGNITYTEGPPDANGVPTWSSNIQLSPEQQQLLTQQQGMQLQRGGIAQELLGRVGGQLSQPLNLGALHPVNDRGQMYRGAVNANMAPGGMSDNARMMQGMQGAAGQMGNSLMGAVGQAGGPIAQLAQALAANPQLAQQLQRMMGQNMPQGMPQGTPQGLSQPGGLQGVQAIEQSAQGAPGGVGGEGVGSIQQKLANLLRSR